MENINIYTVLYTFISRTNIYCNNSLGNIKYHFQFTDLKYSLGMRLVFSYISNNYILELFQYPWEQLVPISF